MAGELDLFGRDVHDDRSDRLPPFAIQDHNFHNGNKSFTAEQVKRSPTRSCARRSNRNSNQITTRRVLAAPFTKNFRLDALILTLKFQHRQTSFQLLPRQALSAFEKFKQRALALAGAPSSAPVRTQELPTLCRSRRTLSAAAS